MEYSLGLLLDLQVSRHVLREYRVTPEESRFVTIAVENLRASLCFHVR